MQTERTIAPALDFPISLGDEVCFETVFKTFHQPLVYYASKFVEKDDAKDLVENVFVRVWQKKPVVSDTKHLQNYLYLAIRNACLNHMKQSTRMKERQMRVVDENGITEESHLQTIIRAEVLAEIYRAINDLPSQCAKVITLAYIDGKTNSEIAEEMDLSVQTVKNHKLRAIKSLKDNLSDTAYLLIVLLLQNR